MLPVAFSTGSIGRVLKRLSAPLVSPDSPVSRTIESPPCPNSFFHSLLTTRD